MSTLLRCWDLCFSSLARRRCSSHCCSSAAGRGAVSDRARGPPGHAVLRPRCCPTLDRPRRQGEGLRVPTWYKWATAAPATRPPWGEAPRGHRWAPGSASAAFSRVTAPNHRKSGQATVSAARRSEHHWPCGQRSVPVPPGRKLCLCGSQKEPPARQGPGPGPHAPARSRAYCSRERSIWHLWLASTFFTRSSMPKFCTTLLSRMASEGQDGCGEDGQAAGRARPAPHQLSLAAGAHPTAREGCREQGSWPTPAEAAGLSPEPQGAGCTLWS